MSNILLRCSEIIMLAYLMNLASTSLGEPALFGFICLIVLPISSEVEGARK